MSGSTVDHAARLDAAHQAQVVAAWRDWHRYLTAHRTLLDAQTAEVERVPSFERVADGWEAKRAQAEAELRRVPQQRRALFDQAREQRRLAVYQELERAQRDGLAGSHSGALDAHAVDRQTVLQLLADAEGEGTTAPDGLVPWSEGRWYQIDLASVRGMPSAADYAVDALSPVDRRRRLTLLGILLLLLMLGVWMTWPRGARSQVGDRRAVRVNGMRSTLWTPSEVLVTDGSGALHTYDITATTSFDRVAPDAGAYWRSDTPRPLTLCLPHERQRSAVALRVRSGGDLPERLYVLSQPSDVRANAIADVVLTACGADAPVRRGTLTAVRPFVDAESGTRVPLGDNRTLALTAIEVVGPGQDRTIPQGQLRVVVRVRAPDELDWSQLAPTLVTAGGATLLPGETDARAGTTELVYLAPAWQEPAAVAFSISPPDASISTRWRATLPVPPTRLALLGASLDVLTIEAHPLEGGDGITLRVVLRNRDQDPLLLEDSDLAATQGSRSLMGAPIAAFRTPLRPGETRTLQVMLTAADPSAGAIEVTVGARRYRLRFGEPGAATLERR